MKRAMFTAEQILGVLKEQQAGDMTVDGTWKYVGLESGTLDIYRFRWGSDLDRAMHHDRSMRLPRRESTACICDNAISSRMGCLTDPRGMNANMPRDCNEHGKNSHQCRWAVRWLARRLVPLMRRSSKAVRNWFCRHGCSRGGGGANEQAHRIRLSLEDQRAFVEALLDPPEPTPSLRSAFRRHRELIKESR